MSRSYEFSPLVFFEAIKELKIWFWKVKMFYVIMIRHVWK